MPSLSARIRGHVQGVGYRAFAAYRARERGLFGYAQNLGDGSVEIYAEGERKALDEFVAELQRGPTGAWIEECSASFDEAERGLNRFEIR